MPAPLEPIEPTAGDTETSTRAISGPFSRRADFALWGAHYKRGRGIRAIISTPSSSHYLIIYIVSFIYFLYVLPLCFPYYSSTCNPMLLIFHILGLVVLLVLFLYFHEVIQIYQFFITLSIILFQFLYSFLLLFLKHVVSPILLKLHIIQEAPLPPYNFNRSCHIEDNV